MFHSRNLPYRLSDLLGTSPVVFTIAVLYGETWPSQAIYKLPQSILFGLKSYVYQAINSSLVNAAGNITVDLITNVRCIAGYEACFSRDLDISRHHLRGARTLVQLFNGPNFHNYFDRYVPAICHIFSAISDFDLGLTMWFRNLRSLQWQDRVVCYLSGDNDHIWEPAKTAYWNPASSLFLSTLPARADLGQDVFRRLMIAGHMTPGNEFITILWKIQNEIRRLFNPSEDLVEARKEIDGLEMELLQRDPDNYPMILTYTESKYEPQRLSCEALRRAGLVLVSAARHKHIDSAINAAKLDHAVAGVFMLDLTRVLKHSPETTFWTLCIAAPYASTFVRQRALDLLVAASSTLGIRSWLEAKTFLASLLYYPEIQEESCPRLLEECERHVRTDPPPKKPGR